MTFHELVQIDPRLRKSTQMVIEERYTRFLDIGCSQGNLTQFFKKPGAEIYGVDINPLAVQESMSKGIKAQRHDIRQSLPFENSFFEVVWMGEILEHVEDTDRLLAETLRVLKPGGKLILTVPNILSLENRLRMLVGRYPLFADYHCRGDNHMRFYTLRTIVSQLRERGFKIERVVGSRIPLVYTLFTRLDDALRPLSSLAADFFPGLAMHAIIKAKKNS